MKKNIIVFLVLMAVSFSPAFTVNKETKYMMEQLDKIAAAMARMEEKLNAVSADAATLAEKIRIMEEKVGAVAKSQADNNQDRENLQLTLQYLKEEMNELKNLVNKINERLVNIPAGAAPAGTSAETENKEEGLVQPAESTYYTSYSDYLKKNYDLAIQGFRQFIATYPDNHLADNSLYWLGECYYAQRKYPEAVETFKSLRTKYAEGDKVADAMLKEGFALIELGRQTEGIDVLKQLVSRFPLSEEAPLAEQKIKEVSE